MNTADSLEKIGHDRPQQPADKHGDDWGHEIAESAVAVCVVVRLGQFAGLMCGTGSALVAIASAAAGIDVLSTVGLAQVLDGGFSGQDQTPEG